jgi:hypothetical protein
LIKLKNEEEAMSLGMHTAQKLALAAVCLCLFVPPVVAVECLEVVGELPLSSEISAIAVSGNHVYLGTAGFLLIVDVSDPFATQPVGATWITSANFSHIAVSGDYAYVTYSQCVLGERVQGGYVVDVSDPTNPTRLGWLADNAGGVAISGDFAFIPDAPLVCEGAVAWSGGLPVLDVSNPNDPVQVGYCGGYFLFWATDIALSGGYAYVSNVNAFSVGLWVVNVQTPTAPFEAGFADTPEPPKAVAVWGDHVFVADGPGGLRIFDVSDPTAPYEVGSFATPYEADSVAVAEGYAYVGSGLDSGVWAVDVSTPGAPSEVGYSGFGGKGVALSAGYVYTAGENWWGSDSLYVLRACPLFSDGFESGDTSAWSLSSP